MVGQRIVEPLNENAELGNVKSGKLRRRARALKIGKIIRRCKAETKALKKLDDPYSDRSYWALVKAGYLPAETSDYVARYVAAAVAGEAGVPSQAVLAAAGY